MATSPTPVADLARTVLNNLENQQDWTALRIHDGPGLPRPLISGLPPRRLYVHPDEQIEILKAEKERGERIPQPPEAEWVLPTHLSEKWSLNAFASVFDAIDPVPPGAPSDAGSEDDGSGSGGSGGGNDDDGARWSQWRGPKRRKRVLLATVQDDSTVVYYLMHDGIVKPRQN